MDRLAEGPRTSIAVLDLDGTLVPRWLVFPWVDFLAEQTGELERGAFAEFRSLSARYLDGSTSHDQFASDVAERYAELTACVPDDVLAQRAATFVDTRVPAMVFPFVRPLLRGLAKLEISTWLITGAPEPLAACVAHHLGVGGVHALVCADGAVRSMPGTSAGKAEAADAVLGAGRARLAVGDSESDAPLFGVAERRLVVGSAFRVPDAWRATSLVVDAERARADEILRWLTSD